MNLLLIAITLFCLNSFILVTGQRQTNTRVLCEKIASQCRETCQLYWDQCHTGQEGAQMIPGGGPIQGVTVPTNPASQSIPASPPIAIITNQQLRPLRDCGSYLSQCDMLHPCCKGYNCRFLVDKTGFGRCH